MDFVSSKDIGGSIQADPFAVTVFGYDLGCYDDDAIPVCVTKNSGVIFGQPQEQHDELYGLERCVFDVRYWYRSKVITFWDDNWRIPFADCQKYMSIVVPAICKKFKVSPDSLKIICDFCVRKNERHDFDYIAVCMDPNEFIHQKTYGDTGEYFWDIMNRYKKLRYIAEMDMKKLINEGITWNDIYHAIDMAMVNIMNLGQARFTVKGNNGDVMTVHASCGENGINVETNGKRCSIPYEGSLTKRNIKVLICRGLSLIYNSPNDPRVTQSDTIELQENKKNAKRTINEQQLRRIIRTAAKRLLEGAGQGRQMKLSELTWDVLQSMGLSRVSMNTDRSDAMCSIGSEASLEYAKEKLMSGYGDVLITVDPSAEWYDQIRIDDPKFQAEHQAYLEDKGRWCSRYGCD